MGAVGLDTVFASVCVCVVRTWTACIGMRRLPIATLQSPHQPSLDQLPVKVGVTDVLPPTRLFECLHACVHAFVCMTLLCCRQASSRQQVEVVGST